VGHQSDQERGQIDFGERGPTVRQLMALYDPALVTLLVPGMVVER
jgi:hypothetical protein